MSKVKSALVKLSNPLPMRRYDRSGLYNVGLVAMKSIDDLHRPLVSGWVQKSFDTDYSVIYEAKVAYTYNADSPIDARKWHEAVATETFTNLRDAVRHVESVTRETYRMTIEKGLAIAVGEQLD